MNGENRSLKVLLDLRTDLVDINHHKRPKEHTSLKNLSRQLHKYEEQSPQAIALP